MIDEMKRMPASELLQLFFTSEDHLITDLPYKVISIIIVRNKVNTLFLETGIPLIIISLDLRHSDCLPALIIKEIRNSYKPAV